MFFLFQLISLASWKGTSTTIIPGTSNATFDPWVAFLAHSLEGAPESSDAAWNQNYNSMVVSDGVPQKISFLRLSGHVV